MVWPLLDFSKSIKGDYLMKLHYRALSLGHNIALVKVNKFVKFGKKSFNLVKVMAEIC